jgi:hypothetical protein
VLARIETRERLRRRIHSRGSAHTRREAAVVNGDSKKKTCFVVTGFGEGSCWIPGAWM